MFEGNMNYPSFVRWLAAKLGIRQFNLEQGYDLWKRNLFNETCGRKGLCLENRQLIYDEWLNNLIVTADQRNGRDTVRIRKLLHMQRFVGIIDNSLTEIISNHGINFVESTR